MTFKFGILITSPQPASQAEKEEFKVVQGAYKKGGCVRKSLYDSFTVDNATGNIPLILNTGLPLLGSIILRQVPRLTSSPGSGSWEPD